MKYTRYDLKCKKEKSMVFIITLVLIFCCAYLLGTVTFKFLIKNKMNLNQKSQSTNSKNVINKKNNFIVIQLGIYRNKDKAVKTCTKLSSYGNCFMIDEGENTRVLLGIFSEKNANKLCKKLSTDGVENIKKIYTINEQDLCDKEIVEIVSADIEILMKLSEKDVKGYSTEELKKWVSGLEKTDDKSKNKKVLEELKNYNNNFPKQLDKAKASEIYKYIYKCLNRLKE